MSAGDAVDAAGGDVAPTIDAKRGPGRPRGGKPSPTSPVILYLDAKTKRRLRHYAERERRSMTKQAEVFIIASLDAAKESK